MENTLDTKLSGIQSYKGIPALHISKYKHPAWTTAVWDVPRNALRSRINEEELTHNSVYILQGRNSLNETKQIYVGQAGIRVNGKSAIARLKEHETDHLQDDWDNALVFVSTDENGWSSSIMDLLETEICLDVPDTVSLLNGKIPNRRNVPGPELSEILSNIEVYLHMLIPDVYGQEEDNSQEEALIEKEEISLVVKDLQTDVFGTRDITTPEPTVKTMVDMLPAELFNRDTKFLDPACKGGEFLYEIYNRLMNSDDLKLYRKNENQRSLHILENQLFGIAISEGSYIATTDLLYGDNKRRNIRQLEDFEMKLAQAFKTGYKHGVATARNLIFNTIFKDIEFKQTREDLNNMRFDVIIGNPPYSDSETRGEIGSGNALYPQFMALGAELATYSSLIVPSGWMIQYPIGTKHEVIDELRKNKHIAELHDYADATKVFNGVTIPAGVCYYLIDNSKDISGCKHVMNSVHGDINIIENDTLYESNIGVIFRDPMAIHIKDKVMNWGGASSISSRALQIPVQALSTTLMTVIKYSHQYGMTIAHLRQKNLT
ncbi:MAG: Eco57I restriction-modification methylase domain-containing protein [Lachnospiraceae bacterium]|nr:Eco57I restriction-modification methylase domain-containing protein [Lachnospiraceae bacterium]